MFQKSRLELQCSKGKGEGMEWKDQNSNVCKDKNTTAVFEMISPEFQCLEG